ncbi:protein-tyrosine phosphatase-like protein [Phascolomyces articulosus]|uniref:Protein-tyrosine phosphatase-like protein n=1 Tax=Phascolomyces articulosus TaxID=60185 RepID=A0AAD5KBF7_9FUNG|nr:protein-tyrosine phosphatase-like protein [Phascolomyces articulosus]
MLGCVTGWEWYTRLDRYIILGALPTPAHIKQLHSKERVHTIINLCAEFPGYKSLYDDLKLKQTILPTSDFTIPHLDNIERGVEVILNSIQDDSEACIYLHCKAGRGRSAIVALCYLLRMYLLTPSEAQAILLRCRPQVYKLIMLFDTNQKK